MKIMLIYVVVLVYQRVYGKNDWISMAKLQEKVDFTTNIGKKHGINMGKNMIVEYM